MKDFKVVAFRCKDTSDMQDAVLVGHDVEIAALTVETADSRFFTAVLETAGEINIEYDDRRYRAPEEFPGELTDMIRRTRGACLFDGSVDGLVCWANNWFQIAVFEGNEMVTDDPPILEDPPSDYTEDGIREMLENVLESFLEWYGR